MPKSKSPFPYILNARPDTLDFRDLMYVPTLVEVPTRVPLDDYCKIAVPVLDQGREGACTGFGLATVVNYLLRCRKVVPDQNPVSPWALYQLARRYDEWPGENYDGSSARGAMKGWHRHGACSDDIWRQEERFSPTITADAVKRPLGAYFRVKHTDLVAMHSAIAEAGILYATSSVHTGWREVDANTGKIPFDPNQSQNLGGHAFALVAYDENGFWIQNSWGDDWGLKGFAQISYDDWLMNSTDVWVARLAAPTNLTLRESIARHAATAVRADALTNSELRSHIISIGNDGEPRTDGPFGNSAEEIRDIVAQEIPRIAASWKKRRVLLYAHGGLVSEESAIQRVAEYRHALLANEIYPLAFIWKTDYWTTLSNILKDALRRRRPEGFLDAAKDFMLDRLDDALEPLARVLTGKAEWDEMKENGVAATSSNRGGGRIVADALDKLMAKDPTIELHVVGHSAGAIFHAPLVQYLCGKGKIANGPMRGKMGLGRSVESLTLWAPACTTRLFHDTYLPLIGNQISQFALFTLTDKAEQDDDCANVYHKSLLYLVSNAFEEKPRIPIFQSEGEPILGMENFVRKDAKLSALFKKASSEWVLAPNNLPEGSKNATRAAHHSDFDDDAATVKSTLQRILNAKVKPAGFRFGASVTARREQRRHLGAITNRTGPFE